MNSEIDLQVKACAQLLKKSSSHFTHYLGEPIEECHFLGEAPRFKPLAAWGYFNPFGPTVCSLFLVGVPFEGGEILAFRLLNPIQQRSTSLGLLPHGAEKDSTLLMGTLQALFSDSANKYSIIQSLPSHVLHRDNLVRDIHPPILTGTQLKELLWLSLPNFFRDDLSVICDRLRKFKGDPWKRTKVEALEALEAFKPFLQGKGEPPSIKSPKAPDRRIFDEWFSLVSDPEHVLSEADQMGSAWKGSILWMRGESVRR